MIVVEAPNRIPPDTCRWRFGRWEPHHYTFDLFLAGGIAGCPDWQAELIDLLKDTRLLIYNPRRATWPADLPQNEEAARQAAWEIEACKRASHAVFWFPAEGPSPRTLLELGVQLGEVDARRHRAFTDMCGDYDLADYVSVGCHPEYAYRGLVEREVRRRGETPPLFAALAELAADLIVQEQAVIRGLEEEGQRMCLPQP